MVDLHSPLHLIVLAGALVLCVAALVTVQRHWRPDPDSSGRTARIAWSVAVLLLPIVGPLLWFAFLGLDAVRHTSDRPRRSGAAQN